jgi:hypothetical protein
MNFLPEDYVEKRQAARSAVIFVGLLLVVVAGIVTTYAYKKWQTDSIFIEQAKVNAQFEEAERRIAEANEIDRQKATMVAKAELATTLMERVPRSVLLRQLTELQPKAVQMISLELKTSETQGPAAPKSAISDLEKAKRQQEGLPAETATMPVRTVTVDLISMAPTDAEVAKYIAALSKSNLVTDVNLLFSEEFKVGKDKDIKNIRRFHVQMRVDPKADLRQVDVGHAKL